LIALLKNDRPQLAKQFKNAMAIIDRQYRRAQGTTFGEGAGTTPSRFGLVFS